MPGLERRKQRRQIKSTFPEAGETRALGPTRWVYCILAKDSPDPAELFVVSSGGDYFLVQGPYSITYYTTSVL